MPSCSYCSGPITGAGHTGRPWPGRASASYCCYGCLSLGEQRQQEASAPEIASGTRQLGGLGIRIGIALLIVAQSMIFGLALNLHDDVPLQARWYVQTAILCATLLVIVLLGGPLFRTAWNELRRGRLTIEALFLLTMTGAMAASLQAHVTGHGKIYFEVVSILLVVYTLGKLIGARSRAAALAGSRAWAVQLKMCRLIDAHGRTRMVPVAEVLPGDEVEVYPGETIAVDGVVRSGVGFVSEAVVSGEPFAVVRRPGDRVLAGSASHDSALQIEATTKGSERQVDRLLAAVEDARTRPVSFQAQADRIGRWFFPLVVFTALGTFVYWTFFTESGWEAGLFNAMSVLLVACPCVIGLATPIVIWSALGRLAERGLIVRAGDAIERLAEVDRIMFDKTGTLTDDSFALLDIATSVTGNERAKLLGWLSVIQERSQHPIAKPFAQLPRPFECRVLALRAVSGCGVEAEIEADGRKHAVRIGTPHWLKDLTPQPPSLGGKGESMAYHLTPQPASLGGKGESMAYYLTPQPPSLGGKGEAELAPLPFGEGLGRGLAQGEPELLAQLQASGHRVDVAVDGELVAIAVLAERLRDSARETLDEFRRAGLPVEVLTGDTTERAQALDLPAARGGLLPDDKRAAVEVGKTLFIGDGINDAAALASAHAGVALASGTDLAVAAADITLYHTDLRVLPWAIAVSRSAIRSVRRNLYRALCYNAIGMTLAACGILHPVAAVFLMLFSSLSLIFSATRVGVVPNHCSEELSEQLRSNATRRSPSPVALRTLIHGVAFGLQGIVFVMLLDSLREPFAAVLTLGVFGLVGAALAGAWNRWASIPHWLDMCFGMLTLGNFGMLLGWWVDNGSTALHDGGCCRCVEAMRSGVMMTGMWVGMLVLANAAMIWLPRRSGSHGRDHTIAMYSGGNIGMVPGMLAGGWFAAQLETTSMTVAVAASFAGMTVGMLAGMLLGTLLIEKLIVVVRGARRLPAWLRVGRGRRESCPMSNVG